SRAKRPFFIQCSFPDPHHPFTPPGRFWKMYSPNEVELPSSFNKTNYDIPPHVRWLRQMRDERRAIKNTPAPFACTEREAREAIALNYGSISNIDSQIGRVLTRLNDLDLLSRTVIIF